MPVVALLHAAVPTLTGDGLLDDLGGGALPHVDVLPEQEVPHLTPRPEDLLSSDKQEVPELAGVTFQVAPDRPGPLLDLEAAPLCQGVDQEVAEEVGVGVLGQLQQVGQVELEVTGKLEQELVDTVQPLQEYGTPFVDIGTAQALATAAATHL